LIESTQTLIDQHFHQEEIGYGLLVVCAVLLVASFVLFRKHAKGGMMSTKDPTSEGEPPQIDSVAPPEREDNRPTNQNTHSGNVPLIISGCVLAIAIIAIIASNSTRTQSPTSGSSIGAQNSASSASTPSVPESDWQVNSETNPVTGIIKKVATLKYRDKQNIIIRLNGKKLDCYITTDEFLETIDNMHSRVSTVQYKFDDGKVIRQGWTISDDNTALFYPGNCSLLITQLRTAKTLAFEYRPSEKIPETITFNVAGFPEDFKGEEPKAKSIKHVVTE
jgi:invasion protein IalB